MTEDAQRPTFLFSELREDRALESWEEGEGAVVTQRAKPAYEVSPYFTPKDVSPGHGRCYKLQITRAAAKRDLLGEGSLPELDSKPRLHRGKPEGLRGREASPPDADPRVNGRPRTLLLHFP